MVRTTGESDTTAYFKVGYHFYDWSKWRKPRSQNNPQWDTEKVVLSTVQSPGNNHITILCTLISTSKGHSWYSPLWMSETQGVQKELLPLKNLIFQFTTTDLTNQNKTGNVCIMYHCSTFVQQLLHILSVLCRLRHPACNAHAPYCHLWPVRLYNISPHYLINGMIFHPKKISKSRGHLKFQVPEGRHEESYILTIHTC